MYKLENLGINGNSKFLKAINSMYENVKCTVRLNGHLLSWFDVKVDLKQGCLLSPILFNLYINDTACRNKNHQSGKVP